MPIYEYRCDKCEHEFEREQRISDDPVKTCPRCRSRRVKRLISQTSFVLKGGGWYSDLYSSPGKSGDAKKGAEAGASSESTDKPAKKDADTSKASKGKGAKAPQKSAA